MSSTPAIVLRRVAFGEADLIVTFLGRSTGRFAAIAKSARKSQRRFAGGLGVGASGIAQYKDRASSDVALLDSFEASEPRFALGESLGRTAHAAYALELCDRLCAARHPEVEVYDWLEDFLNRLERGQPSLGRLRSFELGLLGRLGFAPILGRCGRCGRRDLSSETCRFIAEHGGVFCRDCAHAGMLLTPAAHAALYAFATMSFDDAEAQSFSADVNAACREAVLELVRQHVPEPLKTLEFIAKLGS